VTTDRLWRIAAASLLLLAASCTPTASETDHRLSFVSARAVGLSAPDSALTPLFQSLWALEAGMLDRPVTVVHLGDSHTAGDRFSGRLRERFQERFGSAGRGMLPPGAPFPYFRPTLVSVSQTGGWEVASSFPQPDGGLFSLSGFRITSADAEDVVRVASEEAAGFDYVGLGLVRRPQGGRLIVEIDGREVHRVSTDGPIVQAARLDLPVDPGSRQLAVRPAGDGPVSLLSLTVQRNQPGIVYDSHGVVGAAVDIIGRWEPVTVEWELQSRDPSLIVLAYGTNEGFHDDLAEAEYAAAFAAQLVYLERAAPNAAILVVGPPDANRLPRACRGERDEPAAFSCRPLSAAETSGYEGLFGSAAAGEACRWHPPPNLRVVREIQRRIAAQRGHAFWDWSSVMDGDCGVHSWAVAEPPLAFPDHVHLKPEGYRLSADALFDGLMAEYASYRAAAEAGVAAAPAR
jgi:lysophospholipase L1-like esterase